MKLPIRPFLDTSVTTYTPYYTIISYERYC